MRAVLALSLLLALCASANAARMHHAKPPRHGVVHPGQGADPRYPPVRMDPRYPPVLRDQTPSYNDPSKLGGA